MKPVFLALDQARVEQVLQQVLQQQSGAATSLHQAMHYSILLGGKRIRPSLVYRCGLMLGARIEDLDAPAAALEAIHCYSLIHDDLPAMDNDALRRGKPTCHIAFDEATAILAGDAIQSLAFDILSSHHFHQVPAERVLAMVKQLANASGVLGMCAGQAIDLAHTDQDFTLDTLEQMHRLKTGALIQCAVELAWLASPASKPEDLELLRRFAASLGLAFQVQDDILDIESDTETLGKPQGSDHQANKATYPALLGLPEAKRKAEQLYQDAIAALVQLPYPGDELQALAQFLIARKN
ncbi:(2E,6E)-farnesyl diphosphate synthase [Alkalimonas sp.]|uniref:(2E,6E)-farnesyl diphosphate synthase n=1 Tax=Alkalimonas sp. TaxID=1872453 RepID=UPI002A1E0869|nr:(2E,6E)-farnesyl diphosphate synthase [Alkalimonas sp.]